MSRITWGTPLVVSLLVSGCTSTYLAKQVVEAPNRHRPIPALRDPRASAMVGKTYDATWAVPVGPPEAKLSVAVLEPGDFQFAHKFELARKARRNVMSVQSRWRNPSRNEATAPKGTILVLHGVMLAKEAMLHWALYLAQAGYRIVLVDLRGHGRSTGRWITYGAVEARDLSQVVDDLEKRGRLAGRLGVLGMSYGASIGLQLASRDDRVKAVVALQPFSSGRVAVREFAQANCRKALSLFSETALERAFRNAEHLAGFSWDQTDVTECVAKIEAPILFYHGKKDTWVPRKHSEALHARANPPSRLVVLEEDNHVTLAARLEPICRDVLDWFDQYLAPRSQAVP